MSGDTDRGTQATDPQPAQARWFHDGELYVQQKAGLANQAARLEGMLAPVHGFSPGMEAWLAERRYVVLTGIDVNGRLWCSFVTGPEGFLSIDGGSLVIRGLPAVGDPLNDMPVGQDVGILAIDLANRRRIRINGHLVTQHNGGLVVEVKQAYGNCPAYIHRRLVSVKDAEAGTHAAVAAATAAGLSEDDAITIREADTFFIGTRHARAGADTSHKGGRAGFVRVEGNDVWWPDYAGNNMFNTLGNIDANPETALLFIDAERSRLVQVSGQARIEWIDPGSPGDDGLTGRRVRLHVERVTNLPAPGLHAINGDQSPDAPELR